MSAVGDALKALRTVLLLQEDVKALKDAVQSQGERVTRLAEAHGDLRDRVSTIEGYLRGRSESAAMPDVPRIEG